MNNVLKGFLLALAIVLIWAPVCAQRSPMTSEGSAETTVPARAILGTDQIRLLRERESFLRERLATLSPTSRDYALIAEWLRELSKQNEELPRGSNEAILPNASGAIVPQAQTTPRFFLSRPQGTTNEINQLELAWTEDQQSAKTYELEQFIVEVALSDKTVNGRFPDPVLVKEVAPAGLSGQEIKIPKDVLRSGQKYFWQVLAVFVPRGSTAPQAQAAANGTQTFKTAAQNFEALERRGLTLQRAVSGDDATEGAQFGFLKTFNQKTVYSADFALIYNKQLVLGQRTAVGFQASVQGNLTSDESESEDALQFRAGAIIDRNLKRDTINHLYISLTAKYEADQKFRVGKFISENMVTPTIPKLGIGVPFGKPSDPVQFRWRPFFYFEVGRSFEKGDSAETDDTVLRLTPRVRTMLTLNFLRRALNLNDSFIFVDDFFYFLPLEKTKRRHNMFTSGFVLQVTKDLGFGLTYKSGEAAPKFKHVHTFGGVLTIRFGKSE